MIITINNPILTEITDINFGMWLKGNEVTGWTPYNPNSPDSLIDTVGAQSLVGTAIIG